MKRKGLTKREREFCRQYSESGNSLLAAEAAGFKKECRRIGNELLSREDIASEISRLCALKKQTAASLACTGYARLAFGSIADAVSLLYMESPSSKELEQMDLFSVAEIKRPKDGSMEIKFFDRFKALEKLCEDNTKEKGASPVIEALCAGAAALQNSGVTADEA